MAVPHPDRVWLLLAVVAVLLPEALPAKYVPKWKKQVSFPVNAEVGSAGINRTTT